MNSVSLIGRLTRDPEVRYTSESQMAVARFSIAIDRPARRDGGEQQTDFPNIVVFGRQAENCERFLQKGRLVGIQGRIQTGSYTNKDGVKVYTTEVVASRVEFLEWGDRNERSQGGFQGNDPFAQTNQGGFAQEQNFQQSQPAPQQNNFQQEQPAPQQGGFQNQQAPQQSSQPADNSVPAGFKSLDDDDIPF